MTHNVEYITGEQASKEFKKTVDKVLHRYKKETGDDDIERAFTQLGMPPGHLHSIDKLTSALLLIGKYNDTFLYIDYKTLLLYTFRENKDKKV